MFFFRQTKSSETPSYVDWVRDGYEADETPPEQNLPWANKTPPGLAEDGWQAFNGLSMGAADLSLEMPRTPSLLRRAAGKAPDPVGFTLKFISLTVVPGFFTGAAYLLFRYFMQWSEYPSLAVMLVVFFSVLRHSASRVSDRPSLLELLKFFFHETALAWLMWIFGSLIYTLAVERYGLFVSLGTFAGLLTAGVVYYFAASRVSQRTGAHQILRYLLQVASIVVTNLVGVIAGYFLGGTLWELVLSEPGPPYASYVIAMFFAFVSFWIAVKQFYIQTNSYKGATSRAGRGSDILIG